jgi:hypothetical protein
LAGTFGTDLITKALLPNVVIYLPEQTQSLISKFKSLNLIRDFAISATIRVLCKEASTAVLGVEISNGGITEVYQDTLSATTMTGIGALSGLFKKHPELLPSQNDAYAEDDVCTSKECTCSYLDKQSPSTHDEL